MSLHKINNITVKHPINNQPIFSRDLLHAISKLHYAYHKWSIMRRSAYFIFPVKGAALIPEQSLFQLWVKHWREYREN